MRTPNIKGSEDSKETDIPGYGSWAILVGFLIMAPLMNYSVIPHEERGLEVRFGDAYREYKNRVPRWFGKV